MTPWTERLKYADIDPNKLAFEAAIDILRNPLAGSVDIEDGVNYFRDINALSQPQAIEILEVVANNPLVWSTETEACNNIFRLLIKPAFTIGLLTDNEALHARLEDTAAKILASALPMTDRDCVLGLVKTKSLGNPGNILAKTTDSLSTPPSENSPPESFGDWAELNVNLLEELSLIDPEKLHQAVQNIPKYIFFVREEVAETFPAARFIKEVLPDQDEDKFLNFPIGITSNLSREDTKALRNILVLLYNTRGTQSGTYFQDYEKLMREVYTHLDVWDRKLHPIAQRIAESPSFWRKGSVAQKSLEMFNILGLDKRYFVSTSAYVGVFQELIRVAGDYVDDTSSRKLRELDEKVIFTDRLLQVVKKIRENKQKLQEKGYDYPNISNDDFIQWLIDPQVLDRVLI